MCKIYCLEWRKGKKKESGSQRIWKRVWCKVGKLKRKGQYMSGGIKNRWWCNSLISAQINKCVWRKHPGIFHTPWSYKSCITFLQLNLQFFNSLSCTSHHRNILHIPSIFLYSHVLLMASEAGSKRQHN